MNALLPLGELDKDRMNLSHLPTKKSGVLTAAAKSSWPAAPPAIGLTPPGRGAEVTALVGLGAVGIGGFPGTFGPPAPGFAPMGGAGLGLVATGGGGLGAIELDGRELDGLEFDDALSLTCGVFFQGVAEPLAGPIPGNTEIGLAEASAVTDWIVILGPAAGAGLVTAWPAAGGGGGRRPIGGGGGAEAAFGFGGMSSR